jgi:LAO/AO transport system kinase
MSIPRRNRLSAQEYAEGVLSSNRVILSRAITLIESSLPADRELARQVMEQIIPYTGRSIRIGITGVPGVGKSTFIESFGKLITAREMKLAVLAVDPTSQRSKGSIMGDKTRMEELSRDPFAFIRPTPSGDSLGGVSRKTRETMLLCEAAGFEVIFIETVGVGQSETAVRDMTDFFLLLMLAGAGDELQGIKKGIMEMADAIAITKADGDNAAKTNTARLEYQNALHLFPLPESGWSPKVVTCSALTGKGLAEIWQLIEEFQEQMQANLWLEHNRKEQSLRWMHETIRQNLLDAFYADSEVKASLHQIEQQVMAGQMPAINAADELLKLYKKG